MYKILQKLFKEPKVEQEPNLHPLNPYPSAFDQFQKIFSYSFQPIDPFIAQETYNEGRFQDSVASIAKPNLTSIASMGCGETITPELLEWYASYGFIGWQACALLSQHWLIHNACSIPPEDAVRHGWKLRQGQTAAIEDHELETLTQADKTYRIKSVLKQFGIKANIFGFCLALFKVKSFDPNYYAKPFNIDAVMPDSYEGIILVEPFWITPQMTSQGYSDPASLEFHDPEFWNINGKLYHHSHFVIIRCAELSNILKPTYYFGGISLVQRIYERVYAAERTANEAPILAQSKRLFIYKTDMKEAIFRQQELENKAQFLRQFADNFSIQFAEQGEDVQKLETSLADVDDLIANQYSLVAAVAGIPITKLLCTSPQGLNSTGEGEMLNYHEKLESIQSEWFEPLLDRHYQILVKSLGFDFNVQIAWEPTDSVTAEKQAAINAQNAQTIATLIQSGVISPLEGRMYLQDNKKSGFVRFEAIEPISTPATRPDNLAMLNQDQSGDKAFNGHVQAKD